MTTSLIAGRFGAEIILLLVLWGEFRDFGDFAVHHNERVAQKCTKFHPGSNPRPLAPITFDHLGVLSPVALVHVR